MVTEGAIDCIFGKLKKERDMKTISFLTLVLFNCFFFESKAQEIAGNEKFGNTLNTGVGIGYYGYVGHSIPVLHLNYEFDVAKNFTLAPFITYFTYQNYSYWGNPHYPYRDYYYRQTVIPIGVKGSYYFDELLKANPKWDFYLAGSLGFAIRRTIWEQGYYGDVAVRHGSSGLYLDGHLGAEYHLNQRIGLLLDLSTGISTLCLAFHL